VLEIRDKAIRFVHVMYKGDMDEIAATTELTGVHIDTDARKACSFPPEVKARANELIAAARKDEGTSR